VPLGPVMQYSSEKPVDPLSVHVYGFAASELADKARTSESSLYEDDGLSNQYQRGAFQRTSLRYRQTRDLAKFELATASGDSKYSTVPRNYQLHFHGLPRPASVRLDGKDIPHADRNFSRARASWSANEATGEISIFIPRSARRAFTVEFSAPQT